MLSKATPSPSDVLDVFSSRNIPVAFFSATDTALQKSIIDATAPLRDLLKEQGIHDFDTQQQGTDNKVLVPSYIIGLKELIETKTSLYRPETKQGDPRFWVYNFGQYAKPWDLYAAIVFNGHIYILNCNDSLLLESINDTDSPLGSLAAHFKTQLTPEANELLSKLKGISAMDYVPSMRDGDTGIGYTLETLLGIDANSSKKPDYKGIELKSSRKSPSSKKAKTRTTLLSQVPNWKISAMSPTDILNAYGYDKDGRLQLYCSLSALKQNSLELGLLVDDSIDQLFVAGSKNKTLDKLMAWEGKKLRSRILEKHNETFWIKADSKEIDGKEHFHYYEVVHTRKPLASNLFYLLNEGTIEVDLTISEKPKGVRDHGYLFKIWANDLDKLMPNPSIYQL